MPERKPGDYFYVITESLDCANYRNHAPLPGFPIICDTCGKLHTVIRSVDTRETEDTQGG